MAEKLLFTSSIAASIVPVWDAPKFFQVQSAIFFEFSRLQRCILNIIELPIIICAHAVQKLKGLNSSRTKCISNARNVLTLASEPTHKEAFYRAFLTLRNSEQRNNNVLGLN